MRRETTNAIRTVLEEVLPPFVRDSAAMRWLFRRHWGRLVDDLEDFRARIPFVTPEEYRDVYARLPRVQSETDNSRACIDLIAGDMLGATALDVGCGPDRKSVAYGRSVSVLVDIGGRRIFKKKNTHYNLHSKINLKT